MDSASDTVYILDYKSSRSGNYKDLSFGGGRKLQPALYAEALKALKIPGLNTKRISAGYLPLKDDSKEHMIEYDQKAKDKLGRILSVILELMEKGLFYASGNCDWCNYRKLTGETYGRSERQSIAPNCPKCGHPMQLKTGKYGEFWSCTKFPDCRGTRRV